MQDLLGRDLGEHRSSYVERDVILYALAVGARPDELNLIYEAQLQVLPTFALTLGLWAVEAAGGLGAYDRARTLHVGQSLSMHAPIPLSGEIETSATVTAVWDKGSAALVGISVASAVFDATYIIYVPDKGGFGGERGRAAPAGDSMAAADEATGFTTRITTWDNQATLYRLTGDLHPVHVDPQAARAAGFDRPILHGLCTLGCVVKAVAAATSRNPASLTELSARLTAPVYPGSAIEIDGQTRGTDFTFVASVDGVGNVTSGAGVFAGAG